MQTGAQQRDALVTAHLALVDSLARAVRRRLPAAFELEDLASAGRLGLMRAAERYEPGGAPFSAYARPWVHGAILDSVRRAWCDGRGRHAVRPLAEALPAGDDWLGSEDSDGLIDELDAAGRMLTIAAAVEALPAGQKSVLHAVYTAGAGTVSAAARGLGIAPARAYRLHKLGITALRARFAAA